MKEDPPEDSKVEVVEGVEPFVIDPSPIARRDLGPRGTVRIAERRELGGDWGPTGTVRLRSKRKRRVARTNVRRAAATIVIPRESTRGVWMLSAAIAAGALVLVALITTRPSEATYPKSPASSRITAPPVLASPSRRGDPIEPRVPAPSRISPIAPDPVAVAPPLQPGPTAPRIVSAPVPAPPPPPRLDAPPPRLDAPPPRQSPSDVF